MITVRILNYHTGHEIADEDIKKRALAVYNSAMHILGDAFNDLLDIYTKAFDGEACEYADGQNYLVNFHLLERTYFELQSWKHGIDYDRKFVVLVKNCYVKTEKCGRKSRVVNELQVDILPL